MQLFVLNPWLFFFPFSCTLGSVPIQEEVEKKRSADVLKGATGKADEAGRKTVTVVSKDHRIDDFPHNKSPMVTRTRVRRETVKHMIYQNC